GRVHALDSVSLSVGAGEFVSILGASGSGKTTLLMAIAGFTRPSSGSIRFGARHVTLLEPHKRNIGMVFQSYALFPNMTVAGNVAYPLRLRGVGRSEIAERVAKALQTVRLEGFGDRAIDQLSGGQRQRVALARAIVFGPDILLMDEPLSALDKKLREQMQIEVRHLHRELGLTTIFVTHDQHEAFTMSDRIALIDKGRFVQIGSPTELYNAPASRFVADFVGQSYFVPVSVASGTASLGNRPLRLARAAAYSVADQFLVLRPEHLRVMSPGESEGDDNILAGRFKELIFQGESYLAFVDLPGGVPIALRLSGHQVEAVRALDIGSTLRMALSPEYSLVLP
ncbi:MAG: ABC transporter ATP-binding protein, partial [Bosea sp. (in: a-proteobacteria)]|nr:ABC transporter ATP-binding protein [Bosea sp. (in: a-proteobacteria)]